MKTEPCLRMPNIISKEVPARYGTDICVPNERGNQRFEAA
jgi:hypothetical protein